MMMICSLVFVCYCYLVWSTASQSDESFLFLFKLYDSWNKKKSPKGSKETCFVVLEEGEWKYKKVFDFQFPTYSLKLIN